MSLDALLRQAGNDEIDVEATASRPRESLKYSMASYGAQFCEVGVREDSGEVRVSRWVGSFDCGRGRESKNRRQPAPRRHRHGDRHGVQ